MCSFKLLSIYDNSFIKSLLIYKGLLGLITNYIFINVLHIICIRLKKNNKYNDLILTFKWVKYSAIIQVAVKSI